MQEDFLHYVWQYQLFKGEGLCTTQGAPVQVVSPGRLQHNAGPDFTEAQLHIDEVLWAGQVEIHLKSSDWFHHQHQEDPAYHAVILHVVWEDDRPVSTPTGQPLATLELKDRVASSLIAKYENLTAASPIPCGRQFMSVPGLVRSAMLDQALVKRLERKSAEVLTLLEHSHQDWDELTYRWLLRALGTKTNQTPMEMLAKALPFKRCYQYAQQLPYLEALLFGMAGFLAGTPEDAYQQQLKKDFDFLRHKHQLEAPLEAHLWKWARMRPANFPTVRLAQLAALIHQHGRFFARLVHAQEIKPLLKVFDITPSAYWQTHYRFGKPLKKPGGKLGKTTQQLMLINVVAPLLAAYSQYTGEAVFMEKSLQLLEALPPEKNHIIDQWKTHTNWKPQNCWEGQAALELYSQYCQPKKCLQCQVGVKLMRV